MKGEKVLQSFDLCSIVATVMDVAGTEAPRN